MTLEILKAYKPILTRDEKYSLYVYNGGRGGGKSIGITDSIIILCLMNKETAFCGREIKDANDKSIIATFKERLLYWSSKNELDKRLFKILKDRIEFANGSIIYFVGFSEITIDNMKSVGASLCWVDEAHSLTKNVIDILLPSVRKENSKGQKPISIFSFNRQLINDPIFVEANSRNDCFITKVNYYDNPYFKSNKALNSLLEQDTQRLKNNIITESEFNHTWLGEPFVEEEVLIPFELIKKCLEFKSTSYDLYLPSFGIDVARGGKDTSVISIVQGNKLLEEIEFYNLDSDQLSEKVIKIYNEYDKRENEFNKKRIQMFIDSCGIGASLIDCLKIKGYSFATVPVNFANSPEDERYYNKRAECYGRAKLQLTDGFEFNNKCNELVQQLVYVPYDFKRSDKLKIKDKEEIKKRLGRSPDNADAFVLNFSSLANKLRETSSFMLQRLQNRTYNKTSHNCFEMCNIFK